MFNLNQDRKTLLRWGAWFFFANCILFWIIGLHYLFVISPLQSPLLFFTGRVFVATFITLAHIGQLGVLAFIPYLAVGLLTLLWPKPRIIIPFAVALASLAAILLLVDTFVFNLYRFHLNGFIFQLILGGLTADVLDMSWFEIMMCGLIGGIIILLECLLAYLIWRKISQGFRKGYGKWIIVIVAVCFYQSYSMIILSGGLAINRHYTDAARYLPFYNYWLSLAIPIPHSLVAIDRGAEINLTQPKQYDGPVNYPLKPMVCEPVQQPLNLVMIVIDTWRFDMLNPQITPHITNFAKEHTLFTQHFSGGNSTAPGIFTLFYGIPSTYWSAMLANHQGPVLIDELLRQRYQLGIFASGTMKTPPVYQTVFAAVKDIQPEVPGANPYQRDLYITQKFQQFVGHASQQKQPFFSFLFYDAAHSYCKFDEDLGPLKPTQRICDRMSLHQNSDPAPYFNRHKNALMLVDKQVAIVLETLKKHNLLDNTVVIITGDHGEEFNDNHLGYWGHGSNYTAIQTHVPFIVHWPRKNLAKVVNYKTSHYDVVPTLMTQLLGCQNPASDYSIGHLLTDKTKRDYLIIGSYIGFGIVEEDRITTVYPSGDFQIDHPNGQPFEGADLNIPTMRKVLNDTHKFYKTS